jgi:CHAT domain-containing protein
VAYPLQNLGILARRRKQYDQALEYFWRSEKIREKALGSQNTLTATLLVNIGNVYASKGDMAKSLELYLRALDIFEITASPYSEATLKTLNNISRTYAVLKETSRAVEIQERVDKTVEKNIALNLVVGSEREKLAFAEDASYYTQRSISMHVREAPDNQRAADNAITAVLQRKGRVLDAVSGSMAALHLHLKPEDQKLLDDLSVATSELASLSLGGPKKMPPADYKTKLASLEKKRDSLEDEIGRRSHGYYSSDRIVTLAAVQSAIPSDAALLEFSVFVPFDANASLEGNQFGDPRYVAYVITNQGDVRWKDLGLAADVDAAVDTFRKALRDPERSDAKQASRALAAKVLDPLRPLLGESKHLLVSPDGQLNLVPFGALLDEKNQFALERYSISYLSTGRDLLRLQASRSSKSGPVLFADPLFGDPEVVVVAKAEQPRTKSSGSTSARRSVTTATDISSVYFAPLTGTAREANSIHSLFPQSAVFTGQRATKSALKEIEAPSILHIATHGFFLQEQGDDSSQPPDKSPIRGAGEVASADPSNPLLRSGLAFAGANLRKSSGEDGIFTALEASNLNLWGTKLVTLSACDTGVGEVRTGEGVYGLRRAFFLAGTESLVMSLWPVSDNVTRELMAEYYAGLKRGIGRGEALRQAQLAMLKRKGREHPFYWASFIESGEWANLDGKR